MEKTNISKLNNLVVTSIRDKLKNLPSPSLECCIYKVPNPLRVINLKEYTPQLVSIGPFHRGEKHLQAMEAHKLRYLQCFLNRSQRSCKSCVDVVRTWEREARCCYAETIELSSDDFVEMILVDGSFIVELLWRFYFDIEEMNDPLVDHLWLGHVLPYDTMLLENQLPFFVLGDLFELIPESSVPEGRAIPSFLDLTRKFLGYFLGLNGLPNTFSNSPIKHFVDFMHSCILSSIPEIEHLVADNAVYDHLPTVTELHEAGIKFKKREGSSLFDIKFTNGILEIPPLVIWRSTESLLRNLLAYELCHCTRRPIISYVFLFDGFINTSNDLDLLTHDGIIRFEGGSSEDVSAIFNSMREDLVLAHPFYYSSLCEDLRAYCKKPNHRWQATLKRDYFNTPWRGVSVVVALLLLILTFIQTLYSVKSLLNPCIYRRT